MNRDPDMVEMNHYVKYLHWRSKVMSFESYCPYTGTHRGSVVLPVATKLIGITCISGRYKSNLQNVSAIHFLIIVTTPTYSLILKLSNATTIYKARK